MKKLLTILCLILLMPAAWAKHVPLQNAANLAVSFYQMNNPLGSSNPRIQSQTVRTWENNPTLYIFRFVSGGFVLIAADDASWPVLGYSFENDMPEVIDNPGISAWLDDYSREIGYIISNNLDNSETLRQWNAIMNKELRAPSMVQDVDPLLATLWDQGCFYNTLCPSSSGGQCGHVWTGCVATAMAQIMKYHNFPPQGVGQHTYTDATFGQQTANFGNTTYNWSSMPNSVYNNNTAVSTLMYHAGVSVDMMYGTSGSGAYSEDVPVAFVDYFNYSPDIAIKYKNNYANVEDFKTMLRADLDQGLPIYYSGSNPSEGHAWVCDGYRMSDGMFHFNWGWSGSSNGYYAIGNLNPGGYSFNLNNTVVVHIRPDNPDLIVRVTHPVDRAIVGVGYTVEIRANVVRGSATEMKIYIDSIEKFSTSGDSISFTWNPTGADLGTHFVKAFAMNSTDTACYRIQLNVAEWISQVSGFSSPARAITFLSAVDSNIVWGTASDGNNLTGACSDFTRTTNGGNSWSPGTIPNTTGLASAMIFALDSLKAYVAMFKVSGSNPQGIYATSDGGATWTRQTSASFSSTNSFPNIVHFFDSSNGMCMGDPINGKFEIYSTTDGGTTWTLIPASGNPSPIGGEFGVVGYYSAVHDTIWFGTNKGRTYRSTDKGISWTVSTAPGLGSAYVKPVFMNGNHGLLQDQSSGNGSLCESFNGGTSWTQVNFTGPNYSADIAYVPGTTNTWVRSGDNGAMGCAYSFDGGHTWGDFIGTNGSPYFQMAWVNNHCGWAGGKNASSIEDGVYKFIGLLQPPLPFPINVQANASGHNVDVTWSIPVYDSIQMALIGYNIFRNGTRLNPTPVTALEYYDQEIPGGQYTYCVTALYNIGESLGACADVDVALGVSPSEKQPAIFIYPNPAHDRVVIKTSVSFPEIQIYDRTGRILPLAAKNLSSGLFSIDISGLAPGVYLISFNNQQGTARTKLIVN